jgi:AcrR family transcriptional regulator
MDSTKARLVAAAVALLDAGGAKAVTIRAVAERCEVSHNTPYKHFDGRNDLLATVATNDFESLRAAFEAASFEDGARSRSSLTGALETLIAFSREHEARYRLMFSDNELSATPALEIAALASFQAFRLLVSRYQHQVGVTGIGEVELTGLVYATCHGAIDLEASGRAAGSKGLLSVESTLQNLFDLLEHRPIRS